MNIFFGQKKRKKYKPLLKSKNAFTVKENYSSKLKSKTHLNKRKKKFYIKENTNFIIKIFRAIPIKIIIMIIAILIFLKFLFKHPTIKDIFISNKIIPKKKLKIGVVGVRHDNNVGNNLIKYAISILLSNLGFIPYIIGTHWNNYDITFINKTTNLVIIRNNFNEINKNDYDILMVNSDQTWVKFDNNFYDYGFLRFAQNWNIKKFVYGASIGHNNWHFTWNEDNIIKELLKNFTGISVREKGSIKLIEKHLGITPEYVLDPTLLIDKQYYLNFIKHYNNTLNYNNDYIFIYTFDNYKAIYEIRELVEKIKFEQGQKIYFYNLFKGKTIEDFIYYISNSKAVITQSYHGTVFSIIFNKPFISFNLRGRPTERLKSLGELLGVENRIFSSGQIPDINLLSIPLNLNYTNIEELRTKSINFIKKNLDIL